MKLNPLSVTRFKREITAKHTGNGKDSLKKDRLVAGCVWLSM